ncbi:MAG: hypothetical protein P4L79_17800 [Legionella sp.]|uniref:hypothetical protein n=1 Tax=Legionella sp. TaxID=459 RepID=UPI0028456985|nr:hypothetical protein [Legionella sp.]
MTPGIDSIVRVLTSYWQESAQNPFALPNEKERAQNIHHFIISCTSDEGFLQKLANPKFLRLMELYDLYKATYAFNTIGQQATYEEMVKIIKDRMNLHYQPLSIFEQIHTQVRTLSMQDENINEVGLYIEFLEKLKSPTNDDEFFAMINNQLLSVWELQLLQRLNLFIERGVDQSICELFLQLVDSKISPEPVNSSTVNDSVGAQVTPNSSILNQLKFYIEAQLQKEVPEHQFEVLFDLAAIFSELQDDAALINFLKAKARDDERLVLGSISVEGRSPELDEFKSLVFSTKIPGIPAVKEATTEQLLSISDLRSPVEMKKEVDLRKGMERDILPRTEAAPPSEARKKIPLIYLFRQHLKEALSVKIKLEGIVEDNQFLDLLSKNEFKLNLLELMELDALIQIHKALLREEQVKSFFINLDSAMDAVIALNAETQSASNSEQEFEDPYDDFWQEEEDDEVEVEDEDTETFSCSP